MKNGLTITVTLRKRDTGYKVFAYCTDDLGGAQTAAQVLVDSRAFRHCYAVATDWQGEILFECRPTDSKNVPAVHVPPVAVGQQALPPPSHGYGPPPRLPSTGSYAAHPGHVREQQAQAPRHGYGAPPVPTGRSYGPAPVPPQHVQVSVVRPDYGARPAPALGARDAYGPPPSPHPAPRMLGSGK